MGQSAAWTASVTSVIAMSATNELVTLAKDRSRMRPLLSLAEAERTERGWGSIGRGGSVLWAGGDRDRLARGDTVGAQGFAELLGGSSARDLGAAEHSPEAAELVLGRLPAERLEAGLRVGLHERVLGLAHAL